MSPAKSPTQSLYHVRRDAWLSIRLDFTPQEKSLLRHASHGTTVAPAGQYVDLLMLNSKLALKITEKHEEWCLRNNKIAWRSPA